MRVLLRVLGNAGRYPSYTFTGKSHILNAHKDLAWSAVRQPVLSHVESMEIPWIVPEEIRLYSAVSLVEAHPRTNGRLIVHPWAPAEDIGNEAWASDFGSELFIRAASAKANQIAALTRNDELSVPLREKPYDLANLGSPGQVQEIIDTISPDDDLLLRGLSKFLSANHLIRYREFIEEASLSAYIGLEAALEYIKQYLQGQEGGQKSFKDVFQHIRATFPTGQDFADVLETDYDNRIIMVHPSSRFGEFWAPPFFVEECYDLLNSLVYLYRYILLDEVWEPTEYD